MKPRPVMVYLMFGLALMMPALACNLPTSGTPTPELGVLTQVALTVDAELAGTGTATAPATMHQQPRPGDDYPAAVATQAQATRVPVTATSQPCNEASFIQDVTIADGTKIAAGQAVHQNLAAAQYWHMHVDGGVRGGFCLGDAMGAPAVVNLKGDVPPNGTVDFSVEMKAPAKRWQVYRVLENARSGWGFFWRERASTNLFTCRSK